jgi:hypothetical protein
VITELIKKLGAYICAHRGIAINNRDRIDFDILSIMILYGAAALQASELGDPYFW